MSRTVVITNSTLNKYGFRLLTQGGDLSQYEKNPILLFMHNRPWRGTTDEVLPLGTVQNIRVEGDNVLGDLDFDLTDTFAAKIAAKWDAGIYRMVSAGITPIEFSTDPSVIVQGQTRATVSKWTLDEVSVVDMGANNDALVVKNSNTGKYVTLSDMDGESLIPIINPKNENRMKKIFLALGLAEDATEETAMEAITALQARAASAETETLAAREQAITLAVDSAISQRRITADQKDHYVALGKKAGIEMLNTTLTGIPVTQKPTTLVGGKTPTGEVKKWADYSAEELEEMRSSDKDGYTLVYKAEYGMEPVL